MKNYFLLFILSIFIARSYSQKKPPIIDFNDDISLSGLSDSIRGSYGDQRSTRLIKNLNAKIEDYLIINHQGDTIIVDTSLTINKFHKINYLRKDNFELIPFSNTGHTYNDLSYSVDKVKLFPSFGSRAKHFSYMEIEDVNYYDMPTPFTELMYRSAFEQGQLLDALYSVNTSRKFNFTISRKGLRSLGNYQHFLSSSSNFRFSTNYNSENKRYMLRTHYVSQKFFAEQNGGIRDQDIIDFENGTDQFLDRSVFDPYFENADNELVGRRYYVDHSYNLSKKTDSIISNMLSIGNTISYEKRFYKFNQSSANEYFGEPYNFSGIDDKSRLRSFLFKIDADYKTKNIGDFNLGLEYNNHKYNFGNIDSLNISGIPDGIEHSGMAIYGSYSKRTNKFNINANFSSSISEDISGNSLYGNLSYKLNDDIDIMGNISISSHQPNYNFSLFKSNYISYNWENSFENIENREFNLEFKSNKYFNLSLDYIGIKNYTYFTKDNLNAIKPFQYSDNINLIKLRVSREFSINKFFFDNQIQYQKISNASGVLNVPEIIARNSIYYSSHLLDKALFLQTGFSISYFSKFYMNSYDPLLSEFYVQNSKKIGGFPLIDFFINAKIQQTRLYFKLEHFNSSFTGYNFYSAPNYPYRDFSFRFGLVWNFFL
ncbi:MAG: putative porin [Pelagibacterales bacterium]|nr:putative porin [Pelagibacterales bacterium]